MKKKMFTAVELMILAVGLLGVFGWCANIYKLSQCDFESSYKAEAFRGVGIFVAPAGAVMGFINIEDGE